MKYAFCPNVAGSRHVQVLQIFFFFLSFSFFSGELFLWPMHCSHLLVAGMDRHHVHGCSYSRLQAAWLAYAIVPTHKHRYSTSRQKRSAAHPGLIYLLSIADRPPPSPSFLSLSPRLRSGLGWKPSHFMLASMDILREA